jgi:DNA replication ATP-dependent helicase Dna2
MNEKEFIYSLNRLNVSITRARSKTIVFLPRPLLEPPIQAFEDDHTAPGVAFMMALVQFAEQNGESSSYDLDQGASLTLYRVAAIG